MTRIVGYNPADVAGGVIADGGTGRIVDPLTGAGVFNPNMDPAVVGQDSDGNAYPVGTDMSFGSAIRRQLMTNVINGDFAVPPPDGAGTPIVSDPADAGYNPLPGWYFYPGSDGLVTASVEASATAASGNVLHMVALADHTIVTYAEMFQFIAAPRSQGQQYRALLSAYAAVSGSLTTMALGYQWYKADATTAVGAFGFVTLNSASAERKVDLGLVPSTATYLRVTVSPGAAVQAATADIYEVRCAFLPAEATVGLYSRTTATGAFSTAETQVCGVTVPADSLTAGSTYRFEAHGIVAANAGATVTWRVRIGSSSLSGDIAATRTLTTTGSGTNNGFNVRGLLTVRSVGATGKAIANFTVIGSATQPFTVGHAASEQTAQVDVDTTAANDIELTAESGGVNTTLNFSMATMECVMAS